MKIKKDGLILGLQEWCEHGLIAATAELRTELLALATRPAIDQYGNCYDVVDKYMKDRIAAACLHEFIYTFDPTKLPLGETIED